MKYFLALLGILIIGVSISYFATVDLVGSDGLIRFNQDLSSKTTQSKELGPREVESPLAQVDSVDGMSAQMNEIGGKTYPTQKNSFWGYDFYTSKVDASESVDVGSAEKQGIAKLLNVLEFPKSLAGRLVIVSLDPTIVSEQDALLIPWMGRSVKIFPAIQMENNGLFSEIGGGGVIFINNLVNFDPKTLTHELGHYIGAQLTDEEWGTFYQLRGIEIGTPRYGVEWVQSPVEDFAEVYKESRRQSDSSLWDIQTDYGLFSPSLSFPMRAYPCNSIAEKLSEELATKNNSAIFFVSESRNEYEGAIKTDRQLQGCRRSNKDASDRYGKFYVNNTDELTKEFVRKVMLRLSQQQPN